MSIDLNQRAKDTDHSSTVLVERRAIRVCEFGPLTTALVRGCIGGAVRVVEIASGERSGVLSAEGRRDGAT